MPLSEISPQFDGRNSYEHLLACLVRDSAPFSMLITDHQKWGKISDQEMLVIVTTIENGAKSLTKAHLTAFAPRILNFLPQISLNLYP